jgi:hypothetical protein
MAICYWHSHWASAFAVVLFNAWSGLDGLLRFPAVHDVDSLFALKQGLMLVVRIGIYMVAFWWLVDNRVFLLATFLQTLVALPLMYILALPLDESLEKQAEAADSVVDDDILVRVWHFFKDPEERRDCLHVCRRNFLGMAVLFVHWLPPARGFLDWLDPAVGKALRAKKRIV